MLPAHERFHSHEIKTAKVDLWLVLNDELGSLESRSQIAFEHELFERACGSAGSVELEVVTTLHLRTIERGAGVLQQSGSVASVLWIKTDTDTARHEDLLVFEQKGLIQSLLDRARDIRGILRAWNLGQQDRKLVATETSDCVALAHATRQTLGHRLQESISRGVAE